MFRFIFITFLTLGVPVLAQDAAAFGTVQQDADKEISASADSMTMDDGQGFAEFEGAVEIIQGGTKLVAQKVRAEYTEDRSQIARVIATGSIVLTSGDDMAKGDRAVYDIEANTIVLTGNAYVKQGENTLRAQVLNINTDTGAATMTGRVTTILTPKGTGAQ